MLHWGETRAHTAAKVIIGEIKFCMYLSASDQYASTYEMVEAYPLALVLLDTRDHGTLIKQFSNDQQKTKWLTIGNLAMWCS